MTDKIFEITRGPSQEQLFDSLRLYHEGRSVDFTVNLKHLRIPEQKFTVRVRSISVEDASANKWVVKLYDSTNRLGSTRLEGYYDTLTRKGHLRLAY